jgi:hypothetical protein
LQPLDNNRNPKQNLIDHWIKVKELYGMDVLNFRNWSRYPEKLFDEEGRPRYERDRPKIDAVRVSQPPWYGY